MAASKKPSILLKDNPVPAMENPTKSTLRYTCNDYRAEMMLLAQQKMLRQATLSEEERRKILAEIDRLEKIVGLT